MYVEFAFDGVVRWDAEMTAVPREGESVVLPSGSWWVVESVVWEVGDYAERRAPEMTAHRATVNLQPRETGR